MGLLLLFNGGFMFIAALISFLYNDGVTFDVILAATVTLATGAGLMLATKSHRKELKKREGYIVVTFGWLLITFSGTLPYLFTGAIPSFTNAFFETMSWLYYNWSIYIK